MIDETALRAALDREWAWCGLPRAPEWVGLLGLVPIALGVRGPVEVPAVDDESGDGAAVRPPLALSTVLRSRWTSSTHLSLLCGSHQSRAAACASRTKRASNTCFIEILTMKVPRCGRIVSSPASLSLMKASRTG